MSIPTGSELRDIKGLLRDIKVSMTDGDLVGNSNYAASGGDAPIRRKSSRWHCRNSPAGAGLLALPEASQVFRLPELDLPAPLGAGNGEFLW